MINEFSKKVGFSDLAILEGGQTRSLSEIRHLYWKLLRENRGFSNTEIARLNARTPATVQKGIEHINALLGVDKRLQGIWERVKHIH